MEEEIWIEDRLIAIPLVEIETQEIHSYHWRMDRVI